MKKNINFLKRSFTLVELLVVIAILALLMSLLQPALLNAIYKSQLIVCKKNLNNIVAGMSMYADDNNSLYPKHVNDRGKPYDFGHNRDGKEKKGAIMDLVDPYFDSLNDTFMCPGADEISIWNESTKNFDEVRSGYWDIPSTGYMLNFNVSQHYIEKMRKEGDTFSFAPYRGPETSVSFDIIASDLAINGTTHVPPAYEKIEKNITGGSPAKNYSGPIWDNHFAFQDGSVLRDTYFTIPIGWMSAEMNWFYRERFASPSNDGGNRYCVPREFIVPSSQ